MYKLGMIACVCFVVLGCTNQQMYDAIQGKNRIDCNKYNDDESVRQKCLDDASKSYSTYKREAGIDDN